MSSIRSRVNTGTKRRGGTVTFSSYADNGRNAEETYGRATETYYRKLSDREIDPSLRLLKQQTRDSYNISRTSGRITPTMNMERGEFMNSFNFNKEKESKPLFLNTLRSGSDESAEYVVIGNNAAEVVPEAEPGRKETPKRGLSRRIRVIPGERPEKNASPFAKLALVVSILLCVCTMGLAVLVGTIGDSYAIRTAQARHQIEEIDNQTEILRVKYALALSEISSILMKEEGALADVANLHTPYMYQIRDINPDSADYTVISDTYLTNAGNPGTFGSEVRGFATTLWSLLTE